MLSEMSNEGGLSKLKEVDNNDDESTNGSTQGVQLRSNKAKTIEILARKNAICVNNSVITPEFDPAYPQPTPLT
jgi:hypothetical protein